MTHFPEIHSAQGKLLGRPTIPLPKSVRHKYSGPPVPGHAGADNELYKSHTDHCCYCGDYWMTYTEYTDKFVLQLCMRHVSECS